MKLNLSFIKNKGLWVVIFLSLAFPFFAAGLSEVENDAYILFTYSLKDAVNLKTDSNSIKLYNIDGNQKYVFVNHVLSCGTHMLGFIQKEKVNNLTKYYAAFTIHENPYKIRKLIIDYSVDENNVKAGDIIVDDKKIDINNF